MDILTFFSSTPAQAERVCNVAQSVTGERTRVAAATPCLDALGVRRESRETWSSTRRSKLSTDSYCVFRRRQFTAYLLCLAGPGL